VRAAGSRGGVTSVARRHLDRLGWTADGAREKGRRPTASPRASSASVGSDRDALCWGGCERPAITRCGSL
jgi:hypothetical protein